VSGKTIVTQRLLLEPWRDAVREDWLALNADMEIFRWLGTGDPIPREYSEQEHEIILAQWREHGFGWRSVIDQESGEWIGAAGLNYVGENLVGLPPDEIEFGWWLKPSSWGRGLATEAAIAVRDEAFEGDVTDHLWARHTSRNIPSGRVMEKIGMHFVREAPGAGGVPMRIFDIHRTDWEKLRSRGLRRRGPSSRSP